MGEFSASRAEMPYEHEKALRDGVITAVLFVGRMSHASSNITGRAELQDEVLGQLQRLANGDVVPADQMRLARGGNYAPVLVQQGLCLRLSDGSLVMSGDVGKIITDAMESGGFGSQELPQLEGPASMEGEVQHPAIGG